MAVLRKEKHDHYTVIDNTVFYDYGLSFKAKGLLCQMLSLPDGWSFSIEGLAKLAKDGRDSVAGALKELEKAGYFRREDVRNCGKYQGIEYIVAEIPFTENPLTEKPITANPPQLNTNISNTNESNTKEIDIYKAQAPKKPKKGNLHSNPSMRPTLEEVASYAEEKGLNVDAKFFYDFFTEGEWIDSEGKPVQNWKQKLITWSKQNDIRGSNKKRQRVPGAVRETQGSVRNGSPGWFKPFEAFPLDE